MRSNRVPSRPPWLVANYSTAPRSQNAQAPPQPRQYVAPEQRLSRHPNYPEPAKLEKKSLLSRIWPFKSSDQTRSAWDIGEKDPARGAEAAKAVVRDGVLDPRYKRASRNITLIIVSLPIAIYLSYELFQRRFMGREQRKRVVKKPAEMENTTTDG